MLNIRAYLVTFPNGNIAYESKNSDDRGAIGCNSIESLAENVKSEMQNYFSNNNSFSQVNIDLFPFHQIECPSDLAPRLCSALSEEEKKEFWDFFNS